MKIGILTMQKILNYGSFLQALSLKMQLESRGNDVYFIDIIPGRQVTKLILPKTHNMIIGKFDKYFFKRIENYFFSKKMNRIQMDDYLSYLETDKQLAEGEVFDLVIIGSDEVFNCAAPSPWGFTTQLFGLVENANRVVTYAASCGSTTFEDARKLKLVEEIEDSLTHVSHISVRDRNSFDFVYRITGRKALIHIDPVFLSDYSMYETNTIKISKPYILVYAYSNRITNQDEINKIRQFANSKKLEIICVGMQQRWCNRNIAANAFTLLQYISGASYIITDTFHGTVFSIKYNKEFCTIIRESNRNKLEDLLNTFDLLNRRINSTDDIISCFNRRIDYQSVNEIIEKEQKKSCMYLDNICEASHEN